MSEVTAPVSTPMDALDRLANDAFAGRVVRKDLVRQVKVGANVRLVASEDKFWAHLSSFGDKYVHISENVVYKYERLLGGGVWCQLDLLYNADDEEEKKRPFYIRALKPIQV